MAELKNCPFCGEEVKIIFIDGSWQIVCSTSTCISFFDTGYITKARKKAIKAWNTRVILTDDERITKYLEEKK